MDYVIVPEPEHFVAHLVQMFCPSLVVTFAPRVLASVKFEDEVLPLTHEVDHVGTDRDLPPEVMSK